MAEEFFLHPRVRIAPSPTGFLHLGTARTALFNFLFAKKYQGEFILRIEDTDLERSSKAFEDDIVDNLKWLGIKWDEGPDIGGDKNPYRQSERIQVYAKYIRKLLDENRAYLCFCSEDELRLKRESDMAQGIASRYSGKCSTLTQEQIQERLSAGQPFLVRFRMPKTKITVNDLIKGKVEFDTSDIGDIAISKGLEMPLYNFSVVIDDFEMEISHIIRGDDHLSNTPKQIMIQKALDIPELKYAHLPLILGQDRTKLSKRHGAVSIREYRELGYLPEAMINFMTTLGWHTPDNQEIFSMNELISKFSLDRVQKGAAVFNLEKLNWLNSVYIKKYSDENLLKLLRPYLKGQGIDAEEDYLIKIITLEKERIVKLSDFINLTDFFFKKPDYEANILIWKNMEKGEVSGVLDKCIGIVDNLDRGQFNKSDLEKEFFREIDKDVFLKQDRGRILWPLRAALSGRTASPGPFEMAEILGKQETLERLKKALQKLND